jgi:hypothetical protein
MKSWLCACIIGYCAIASSGCGSSASSGTELLGSYTIMIASMGKTDPDVMTVSPGSEGKLLLTFAAGITTDAAAVNANGLRADLTNSSQVTLAAQPAHIDHSTGPLDGMVTGEGVLMGDGTCDIMLHFAPSAGAAPQDYEISGSKM